MLYLDRRRRWGRKRYQLQYNMHTKLNESPPIIFLEKQKQKSNPFGVVYLLSSIYYAFATKDLLDFLFSFILLLILFNFSWETKLTKLQLVSFSVLIPTKPHWNNSFLACLLPFLFHLHKIKLYFIINTQVTVATCYRWVIFLL